jgi:hypothetical protein
METNSAKNDQVRVAPAPASSSATAPIDLAPDLA